MDNKQVWIFNDPDIFYDGKTVKEFYRGYPYIYRIEDLNIINNNAEIYAIMCWLDMNCTSRYRLEHLTVELCGQQPELDPILPNSFGVEYVYIAFKEERDYIWFKMRWV